MRTSNTPQQTEGNNEKQEAILCFISLNACMQRTACHAVLVQILAPSEEHAYVLTFV